MEPQSTTFFLLLIVVFGALMWWLVVAKQLVFRVLAACLAFIPAMMFGVAAVNKYYDYYQNWSSAFSDLTGSNVQQPEVPTVTKIRGAGVHFSTFLGNQIDLAVAAQVGYTARLNVPGPLSHVPSRTVYVYFPPQYFQKAYQTDRFPVIELLHGFPGRPEDWITVVGVTTMLQELISANLAKPAVLVMPDVNGGRGISLQCLNQAGGTQDATYLAEDLPRFIARKLRVQPPGRAWGIAGYSEGGYCAANLGLQYSTRFGFSGVLSGYFQPAQNQLANPSRLVSAFGGNAALKRENTPDDLVSSLPAGVPIPQFWLGVGGNDHADIRNAEVFAQLLQTRQPGVTLRAVPGGRHTMFTWRGLMPSLLEWMTPRVFAAAAATKHPRPASSPSNSPAAQHKKPSTRHHT